MKKKTVYDAWKGLASQASPWRVNSCRVSYTSPVSTCIFHPAPWNFQQCIRPFQKYNYVYTYFHISTTIYLYCPFELEDCFTNFGGFSFLRNFYMFVRREWKFFIGLHFYSQFHRKKEEDVQQFWKPFSLFVFCYWRDYLHFSFVFHSCKIKETHPFNSCIFSNFFLCLLYPAFQMWPYIRNIPHSIAKIWEALDPCSWMKTSL